jgi:hypothetical protein
VPNDDFRHSTATPDRPPGSRGEHPSDVTAGLLEVDAVAIEGVNQTDVMEHGGDVQQLDVED